MIVVNVYSNGFLIDGHAKPSTCELVSMMGWHTLNVIRDLHLDKEFYASGITEEDKNLGLSFVQTKWHPMAEYIIDMFYDTVEIYIICFHKDEVKINDYRNENFGVGANEKFFKPTKDYYDMCFLKEENSNE